MNQRASQPDKGDCEDAWESSIPGDYKGGHPLPKRELYLDHDTGMLRYGRAYGLDSYNGRRLNSSPVLSFQEGVPAEQQTFIAVRLRQVDGREPLIVLLRVYPRK